MDIDEIKIEQKMRENIEVKIEEIIQVRTKTLISFFKNSLTILSGPFPPNDGIFEDLYKDYVEFSVVRKLVPFKEFIFKKILLQYNIRPSTYYVKKIKQNAYGRKLDVATLQNIIRDLEDIKSVKGQTVVKIDGKNYLMTTMFAPMENDISKILRSTRLK